VRACDLFAARAEALGPRGVDRGIEGREKDIEGLGTANPASPMHCTTLSLFRFQPKFRCIKPETGIADSVDFSLDNGLVPLLNFYKSLE
jgi:hypothetical protein